MYAAEPVTYRVPIFFRYGDEQVLDKLEVNNNSDNMAICGWKMPILEHYCNVLIRNVKFSFNCERVLWEIVKVHSELWTGPFYGTT